eukprot:337878-Rhodomonas_salina.1
MRSFVSSTSGISTTIPPNISSSAFSNTCRSATRPVCRSRAFDSLNRTVFASSSAFFMACTSGAIRDFWLASFTRASTWSMCARLLRRGRATCSQLCKSHAVCRRLVSGSRSRSSLPSASTLLNTSSAASASASTSRARVRHARTCCASCSTSSFSSGTACSVWPSCSSFSSSLTSNSGSSVWSFGLPLTEPSNSCARAAQLRPFFSSSRRCSCSTATLETADSANLSASAATD